MILAIVLSIITFLIGSFIFISSDWPYKWSGRDIGEIIGYLVLSALLAGVVFVFAVVLCNAVTSTNHLADEEYYEYQVENVEIYSLRTSNDLNGAFILGTGTVRTTTKYYVIIKTNIGYQIKDIDASVAFILYTKGQPHLETYTHKGYKSSKAKWFTIGATTYYKIYIPEGSIIENYEIK